MIKLSRLFLCLIFVLFFTFAISHISQAGFGISPPRVHNYLLNRGSFFEQKIVLSRGQPDQDLMAKITIEPSEIDSWITIKPSSEVLLPKGQQQVPIFVDINVPADAEYKNYRTNINIRTSANQNDESQIKIALGAQVNVDLEVSDKVYIDFMVRMVKFPKNFIKQWPLSLFNKIKTIAKIENLGNMAGAPTMIQLDVYDLNQKNILESTKNYNLEKINSFQAKEITTYFPTKLKAGQYWAKLKIFKADELKYEEKGIIDLKKINFSLVDWLLIAGSALILLLIIIFVLSLIFKKRKK